MGRLMAIGGVVLLVAAGAVGAGEITNITHVASGSGWANVFDGGPVVNIP